ncbi:MAG: hypothetical protein ACTH7Q_11355 [Pseudoalteromonas sp.]|uniref:hypothetical protein n=1 Tax=unclassified Pseudoalteromonas TaxID=194690 RepID=UPI003F984500
MIHFRLVIPVLLMFIAFFSVQGNTIACDKVNIIQSTSTFQPGTLHSTIDFPSISLSNIKPLTQHITVKQVYPQPKEPGFKPVLVRLVVSNSSLFLYQNQTEPNYTPIFEFFTPSFARALYLKPLEPPITLPWFTAYNGKKSRLSGWKDANLLYRGVITYHT